MRNDHEKDVTQLLEWVNNHGARIYYSDGRSRVHVTVRGDFGERVHVVAKSDEIGGCVDQLITTIRAAKAAFDLVQDVPF